jgi:very-short-patch-repair endonuclease
MTTPRSADQERFASLTNRCHRLVRFLHEVAESQSERVTRVEDNPLVIWLAGLPGGMALFEHATAGEVVLEVPAAAVLPPPPPLPEVLTGWVVLPDPGDVPSDAPPLRETGLRSPAGSVRDVPRRPDGQPVEDPPTDPIRLVDRPEVPAAYQDWLPAWRIWAGRARADADRRALHGVLHGVAGRLAAEGDGLELVLGTGLLSWHTGGRQLRRHLLTTRLIVEVDPVTSAIRLRVPADAPTRLEDGPLLDEIEAFHAERTNALHERLRGRPATPLGGVDEKLLRDWLSLALDGATDGFTSSWEPPGPPGDRPRLALAPALVLRARGSAALLTYYEKMLDALRGTGRPPLGLVQLVETLEADERLAWLEAEGAASGAQLGADPLFPLPANPEQAHVMERLRHDNGVVVEGPPGTGKTHTIANLVSALLAEGQRVLVTSQKAQALRVLREKLPPSLQRLCVSLTDSDGLGTSELATSISALAAEKAAHHPDRQARRIDAALARRTAALARRDALGTAIQARRAAEAVAHPVTAVAPGWSGTRGTIAARVRRERPRHGWLPFPVPVPPAGLDAPRPPAPLTDAEAVELWSLLRATGADESGVGERAGDGSTAPGRPGAPGTRSPGAPELPVPPGLLAVPALERLLADERAAERDAHVAASDLAGPAGAALAALAGIGAGRLDALRDATAELVRALAGAERQTRRAGWLPRALSDALGNWDTVLWSRVVAVAPAVATASAAVSALGLRAVELPAAALEPAADAAATAARLVAAGETLREHLAEGGNLRRMFRSRAQKDSTVLLTETSVDGLAPSTPALLDLVLTRLRAEVAIDAAARAWSLVGVGWEPGSPLEVRLGRLVDAQDALVHAQTVVAARDRVRAVLTARRGPGGGAPTGTTAAAAGDAGRDARPSPAERDDQGAPDVDLDSVAALRGLVDAVGAARLRLAATTATAAVERERARCLVAAAEPDAPPELDRLAAAVADRDLDAYRTALEAVGTTLAARRDGARREMLLARLTAAHPALADLVTAAAGDRPAPGQPTPDGRAPDGRTPDRPASDGAPGGTADPAGDARRWADRLADFEAAWAWGLAATWLAGARDADAEASPAGPGRAGDLDAELDAAEDAVAAATAELAGARAWAHCLGRMGARESAALRAYADAVAAGGKFTGRDAERYRQAAREAMVIAQAAVPAWVMPISDVLATIPAVRDSFDVVIVDEGSQAGLDSLFLLWLAPRVIIVGDDRQCTPPDGAFDELEPVFRRLDALLPDLPAWLRVAFTPRSSLFTLLRTRFGEVIRLREHFRCMPEIIEWSSMMFYRDAPLVPLRQFGAERLPPLRARYVPHGYTTGAAGSPRNPAEAEALVSHLLSCAADPRYDGRSFGVVVLQGTAQAELIRTLLATRMSVAEQHRRRLRVGTPPDFQGDERDVVFLSMVIAADTATTSLTRLEYQRRFNVAASRARDQVWLFHSVGLDDLDPGDLRHSYLSYVLARSELTSQATDPLRLAQVEPDIPHPRFDTLFEQRVFRELVLAGYHVTPQVEVNGRRIDLVVAGGLARLAVECDGDEVDTPEQIAHDFARERQLRRAGWAFWRVRQSDFESDPAAALRTLWPRLAAAGIAPVGPGATGPGGSAAAVGSIAPFRAGGAGVGALGETIGEGSDPAGTAGAAGAGIPTGRTGEADRGADVDRVAHAARVVSARADATEFGAHWSPIALSELEGLDDTPTGTGPAQHEAAATAGAGPGAGSGTPDAAGPADPTGRAGEEPG